MIAQQLVNGLVLGAGYALVAVGLTLIFGVMNVLNFAHGEFMMVGVLFLYWLGTAMGLNFWVACVAAVVGVFFLGVLVQRLLLSRVLGHDHLNTLLLTFALSTFMLTGTEILLGPTPRQVTSPIDKVLHLGSIFVTGQKVLAVVFCVLVVIGLHFFLNRTSWGRKIRATAQNPIGAAVCGIDMRAVHYWTFGLGCALAAVAGVLLGPTIFFTPNIGQTQIIKGFVIVVLGGMGSVWGAASAAFFLGIMEMLAVSAFPGGWKDMIAFSILILVLIIRPKGMMSKGV